MKKKYTKKQITEAIAYWQKKLNESTLPLDGEIYGRNFKSILRQQFKDYGPSYSADAFVAFAIEMQRQNPQLAAELRRFLGQFASGKYDAQYDNFGDDTGKCSAIAKALVGMFSAVKDNNA